MDPQSRLDRWRWIAVVGVAVLLTVVFGVSCGSSGDARHAGPTAAMCTAWRTFRGAPTYVAPPRSRSEVAQVAARADRAARALEAASTHEFADRVANVVAESGALWQEQLAQWGSNGIGLYDQARAADEGIEAWAARRGLAVRPDLLVAYPDYLGDRQELDDDLFLACTPRPRGWAPPADDPGLAVAPARIAVVTNGADLDVGTLAADGSATTNPLPLSARVTSVSFGVDGRLLALVGWSLTVADGDGPRAHAVGPPEAKWYCPAWSTRVGHVIAAREAAPGDWREVDVDVDTGAVDPGNVGPATVDGASAGTALGDVTCPVPLDASTFLHTVRADPSGLLAVRIGAGIYDTGSPFVSLAACNVVGPTPAPDGRTIAYAVQCRDRYHSGIWISNRAGGNLHQIVTGNAGKPAWLPGGAQLLVPYYPLGAREQSAGLWVVTADGRHARTVSGLPSGPVSWPAATTP